MTEVAAGSPLTADQKRALSLIAIGQLLALGLWFSASAVAPQLVDEWSLDANGESGLTLAVQVGFVAGALLLAFFNVSDMFPARRLFVVAAIGGAVANLGLLAVTADTVWLAMSLRFLTGAFLAGLYPAGLKVMSGWFKRGRGMALGLLVGALTVGSASPHLVRGLGLDWRGVVVTATLLTLVSVVLMTRVADGPHEVPTQPFRLDQVGRVIRNRGVRLSIYGYLGHMWELYAMWTWIAVFVAASADASASGYPSPSLVAFVVIAIGGPASWWAGVLADRMGRTRVAGGAMVISGSCALITPLVFGSSPWILVPVLLIWGATIVADSAQFSAMVTETADDTVRGTALTLQTALGFLLTLITIRLAPALADWSGWQWAFPMLALGPALGVLAMVRLARSPEAARLASGNG